MRYVKREFKDLKRYIERIKTLELDYFGRYYGRRGDDEILESIKHGIKSKKWGPVPCDLLLEYMTTRYGSDCFDHLIASANADTMVNIWNLLQSDVSNDSSFEFCENLNYLVKIYFERTGKFLVLQKPGDYTPSVKVPWKKTKNTEDSTLEWTHASVNHLGLIVFPEINWDDKFSHLRCNGKTLLELVEWAVYYHGSQFLWLVMLYHKSGFLPDYSSLWCRLDSGYSSCGVILEHNPSLFWNIRDRHQTGKELTETQKQVKSATKEAITMFAKKCEQATSVPLDLWSMILYNY